MISKRKRRALLGALTLAASHAWAAEEGPVVLDGLPLLLVDDAAIAERDGLERRFHPAHSQAEPVVEPDRPWEGGRVYIYGAVMKDPEGDGFRMWYLGRPQPEGRGAEHRLGAVEGLRNDGFDAVLYATSEDGLEWKKPELELFSYNGNRRNNIIFDLHSPTVIEDRFAEDAAQRYKMLGALSGYPEEGDRNYFAAYSADGIHWKSYAQNPVLAYSDTITLAQNPHTGEYLAYHKRPADVRGFPRRVIWLSRSMDFQEWSEPELVLVPDEIDDAWTSDPQERTEIYNMSVVPHAAGYLGFPTVFRVIKQRDRDEISPGQSPVDGPIDVQLATSPDGKHWDRPYPRTVMIPRGEPGTYNAGAILGVATQPIDVGDETWLYYTAITTGHGGPLPEKRITIGRADWRLHGYASLNAGPEGGTILTKPLQLSSPRLFVNADASRGHIRVALLEADGRPIEGRGLEDCDVLDSDQTHWRPSWNGDDEVPVDRPVRVEFSMLNARLFSLFSEPASPSSRPEQSPE